MKLIITSDIHEHYDDTLKQIKALYSDQVNAILIAGDITNEGTRANTVTLDRMFDFFQELQKLSPVYFITGNHDINLHRIQLADTKLDNKFGMPPLANVTDRCVYTDNYELNNFSIAGMNMSPCYDIPALATTWDRMTANKQAEEAYYEQFYDEQYKGLDIVLSHCPPTGLTGTMRSNGVKRDIGSAPLRKWIEKHQPKLVICGHVHNPVEREEYIGKTKVINTAIKVQLIEL